MRDSRGREALGKIASQMREMISACDATGRDFSGSDRQKWDRLHAAYDRQEALICKAEGIESLDQPQSHGPSISELDIEELQDTFRRPGGRRRNDPHATVFTKYIRAGLDGLENDERQMLHGKFVANGKLPAIRNAQSVGVGTQGGFIVPQSFSYLLEEAMKWWGGIDGITGEFRTDDGRPFPWPVVDDVSNQGRIIGENVQVTETDVVFPDQVTFNAFIGSSDLCLVPVTLLQDSAFDIDALLAKLLGIRLGRLRNYYCTLGTGTAQPTGLITAAVAAGNILALSTGSTTSISYDNLVDLEHSVDPAYRYNPSTRWMFNDTTLKLLKKLVDGNGRPLWSPGLTASFQDGPAVQLVDTRPSILGHPFVVNSNMASPAANAYTMAFGDFSTFKVRVVEPGITVMRLVERYADYLQQGFMAWQRFDSNLIDAGTHPVAILQQSAT